MTYGSFSEQLAASLRLLCEREGGVGVVADAIKSSRNTLYQLIHGYLSETGKKREIGSRLRGRLDERYPGWHALALGDVEGGASSFDVVDVRTPPSDVLAALGETEESSPVSHLRGAWVRERGYSAKSLAFVQVTDRGMEPTFYSGDMVLLNVADRKPADDAVFAIKTNAGEPVVRRLIRKGNGWLLHRDNPDQSRYPQVALEEGDEVLGRVVMRVSEVV